MKEERKQKEMTELKQEEEEEQMSFFNNTGRSNVK